MLLQHCNNIATFMLHIVAKNSKTPINISNTKATTFQQQNTKTAKLQQHYQQHFQQHFQQIN